MIIHHKYLITHNEDTWSLYSLIVIGRIYHLVETDPLSLVILALLFDGKNSWEQESLLSRLGARNVEKCYFVCGNLSLGPLQSFVRKPSFLLQLLVKFLRLIVYLLFYLTWILH